ncbi:MAG: hypothetical protein AAFQ94_17660 [Bacteroidota bacterium]
MKTLLALLISFFLFGYVYSQESDFSAGYVVTTAGDTLKGKVRDRKYGFQDELINKLTVKMENGKVKRVKKKNVVTYSWGGEEFERMKVSTEIPFVKIDVSSDEFMVRIVDGSVELYKHYYNDFDCGTIEYLYFIKDRVTDDFKRLPVIGYKSIIRKYFLGKDRITAKLDNSGYRYGDIPDLIREGNSERR